MCLRTSTFKVLDNTSGIGYKVVRKTTTPGVYKSLYKSFTQGMGGSHKSYKPFTDNLDEFMFGKIFKGDKTYVLGKLSKSIHTRIALTITYDRRQDIRYPAHIHLYKSPMDAFLFIGWNKDKVVIECIYRKAVCEDYETVVAKEIFPIKEVKKSDF